MITIGSACMLPAMARHATVPLVAKRYTRKRPRNCEWSEARRQLKSLSHVLVAESRACRTSALAAGESSASSALTVRPEGGCRQAGATSSSGTSTKARACISGCGTVSVGVSIAPADSSDPDQLMKNADTALYRAKADGRGTYRFFEPEMDARARARRLLELELRAALTNGEFELYFQSINDLHAHHIIGFEALVRWNHPTKGMIPPTSFWYCSALRSRPAR